MTTVRADSPGRGKILLVIRSLPGRTGGAERLFCDLASMFASRGFAVTIAYYDGNDAPVAYRLDPRIEQVNLWSADVQERRTFRTINRMGARYRKKQAFGAWFAPADWLSRNLFFMRRLHRLVRSASPDLVISFLPTANTASLLVGWMAGAAVVPTNHNVPAHDYASPTRWDQNPVDKKLRLWSLKKADRIHVLFPEFASWFPAEIQERVVAIPNGIAAEFDGVLASQPRRKVIVASGRLTGVKNYGVLVAAWAKLSARHPEWSVEIYGDGPDVAPLTAQIELAGIAGSLRLVGYSSGIREVYLSSEIMCHPAKHEGFGLSVAEAIACGCPVVAFADCPGVNQLVRDGENGLLVERSTEDDGVAALAAGLDRLITDQSFREELRARAPETLGPYRQSAFADRWCTFVDERVEARRGRSRGA